MAACAHVASRANECSGYSNVLVRLQAAAQQAGDMMQDFKTAYLLGICPKSQLVAALIGSLASCWVSTAAYALFAHVYEIGGPKLPAPTAGALSQAIMPCINNCA
jgi:uncharacterized oligopeptide transporter (OPT) family protein